MERRAKNKENNVSRKWHISKSPPDDRSDEWQTGGTGSKNMPLKHGIDKIDGLTCLSELAGHFGAQLEWTFLLKKKFFTRDSSPLPSLISFWLFVKQ